MRNCFRKLLCKFPSGNSTQKFFKQALAGSFFKKILREVPSGNSEGTTEVHSGGNFKETSERNSIGSSESNFKKTFERSSEGNSRGIFEKKIYMHFRRNYLKDLPESWPEGTSWRNLRRWENYWRNSLEDLVKSFTDEFLL